MPWCPLVNTVCRSAYKPGIYVTGQVFRNLWCIISVCVLCVHITGMHLCKLKDVLWTATMRIGCMWIGYELFWSQRHRKSSPNVMSTTHETLCICNLLCVFFCEWIVYMCVVITQSRIIRVTDSRDVTVESLLIALLSTWNTALIFQYLIWSSRVVSLLWWKVT
jgi:hypothetical protein